MSRRAGLAMTLQVRHLVDGIRKTQNEKRMNIEERHKIFRQIMWDYNISEVDIEAVLRGEKRSAGHYDKQAVFVKLLESFSWFTVVSLFSPEELRKLLSDDAIKKLRFKSLRIKYEFVQKRLQTLVPVSE